MDFARTSRLVLYLFILCDLHFLMLMQAQAALCLSVSLKLLEVLKTLFEINEVIDYVVTFTPLSILFIRNYCLMFVKMKL